MSEIIYFDAQNMLCCAFVDLISLTSISAPKRGCLFLFCFCLFVRAVQQKNKLNLNVMREEGRDML